jgi:type IV pilus assembly protein PilB
MEDPRQAIGRLLVEAGVLDAQQLRHADRVCGKLATPRPLIEVAGELFGIPRERLIEALRSQREKLRLGDLLVELGHLRPADLETALAIQREQPDGKRRLGEVLLDHHFLAEPALVQVLSVQLGFPLADPEFEQIDRAVAAQVPVRWCEQHQFVPLRREDGRTHVAFADPTDRARVEAAEQIFGRGQVVPHIARRGSIEAALAQLSGPGPRGGVVGEQVDAVHLVNEMIVAALEEGTSDIHVEPRPDRISVRFRTDGVLALWRDLPLSLGAALSGRIKVLCKADIAERRRHQGGRFFFEKDGRRIDLRVSIYVTVHGENIVMRLLNHDRRLLTLADLGMAPRMLEIFRDQALLRPSGVILVTGPTGSGKTTSLYSCIAEIKDDATSIITAEDPVEYMIDGITQCSINAGIGLTFDETLRHIVRQDPDVIVIGEIRDQFSASTAIQAALTGHKVLTTFHTEDSIGGLLRLLNMEIEAFLVSSTVVSVLAQRLLRKVCPDCAEPYQPTPADLRLLGCGAEALSGAGFRAGRGCQSCRFSGYRGRVAVFELLVLDAAVRDAILARKTSQEIRRICRESTGLVSLFEDGIAKAAAGLTTVSEIFRMLPRLDAPRPLPDLRRRLGV